MRIRRSNAGGNKRLYLASLNPNLETEILLPTVPDNFLTRGKFEDWQIKRICLYENIDDALSGLLQQKLGDNLVYIYEPVACKFENLIKPGITAVPYILALPEWWYCNSLRVRLTHVIQVDKEKEPLKFRYGPRQKEEKILRWAWKEKLDKYGKTMVIKRFSNEAAEEKGKKRERFTQGAVVGATTMALGGNHLLKKMRQGDQKLAIQNKLEENAKNKMDLKYFLGKRELLSDASADWRRNGKVVAENAEKIKEAGNKKLSEIAKQHKRAAIGIGATAIGALAAGKLIKKAKEEKKGQKDDDKK